VIVRIVHRISSRGEATVASQIAMVKTERHEMQRGRTAVLWRSSHEGMM
jgi:hypothetical protein